MIGNKALSVSGLIVVLVVVFSLGYALGATDTKIMCSPTSSNGGE